MMRPFWREQMNIIKSPTDQRLLLTCTAPPALSAAFSGQIPPSRAAWQRDSRAHLPLQPRLCQAEEASPADARTLWGDDSHHQGRFPSSLPCLLPVSLPFRQLPAWIKSTIFSVFITLSLYSIFITPQTVIFPNLRSLLLFFSKNSFSLSNS